MVQEATINPLLKGAFRDNFIDRWKLRDGQNDPTGRWYARYTGYKDIYTTIYDGFPCVRLMPAVPDTPDGTRAASLSTRQMFDNFDMTFFMNTIKQTRGRTVGKNWEVGWIFFRLSDQSHHYYLLIQRDGGLELGRKDREVWKEEQIFLKTTDNDKPIFKFYKWYKIRIRAVGYHIQVWVDNVKYIDIVDDGTFGTYPDGKRYPPSAKMLKGFIGPYVEDADAVYRAFNILPLTGVTS